MHSKVTRFSTQEVAQRAGVHKLTLIRWMKQGLVPEPKRDWRGWRTFDDSQARLVEAFAKGDSSAANSDDPLSKLEAIDWSFADAKTNSRLCGSAGHVES